MTLPGTSVSITEESAGASLAASAATWFVAGFTQRGDETAPIAVRSLAEFVRKCGDRINGQVLYDALDAFFREGGGQAYVVPVYGPTPVKAVANIYDAAGSSAPGDVALTATAKEYGVWGNGLNVEVINETTTIQFVVTHDVDGALETSPVFSTRAEAVAWDSAYVTIALGTHDELPRDQTVSLAGGTNDNGSATDTEWGAALDKITSEYGPGQVSFPGRTSAAAHNQLMAHGAEFFRSPLLDLPDTGGAGDLIDDVAALRGDTGDHFAAAFAPWAVIPGITAGTTRTVPYSAVQAGLIARSHSLGNSANVAAAGENGRSRYAVGLSQDPWTDADRELLNDGGVNVAVLRAGEVRTYGYRTVVSPTAKPKWLQFSGSREICALANEVGTVLERFLFSEIDGRGLKIAELAGEIAGVCLNHYAANALYGGTAAEAFAVDVGAGVNPPEAIAEGQLAAALRVRTSPYAEAVDLTITKISSADAL